MSWQIYTKQWTVDMWSPPFLDFTTLVSLQHVCVAPLTTASAHSSYTLLLSLFFLPIC